jgi:cytochrome c5
MRADLLVLLFCFTLVPVAKAADQNAEGSLIHVEDKTTGQTIYEQHCSVCHQDGIAGAPKFRDPSDWKTRLTDQTIETLTAQAIKGLNAMPAKGTCL